MTSYILKTILCSASLFLIYYLLLEREKMYRFNRFYLLFSLIFSFTVSIITIKVAAPIMPVQETIVLADNSLPTPHTTPIYSPIETTNYLHYLLLAFYGIVSTFLLYRFFHNLTKLLSKIKGNETVNYSGATLVLTNNDSIPFSFLNFIFIYKEKYEMGTIEKEVLQHELTHVKQLHSLDVILIELVIAFAWFNPLLYLFRRSILLNHEFLADESVVEAFNDATSYQLLLFEKANKKNNLMLSSSFNYLITKKRLIMMTRKTSPKVAMLKQFAVIPFIAALGFLFSTKVVAQDNTILLKQKKMEVVKEDSIKRIIELQKAKIAKKQAEKEAIRKKLASDLNKGREVKLNQKDQDSKSLLEQKIKLDNEQKAQLLDEQKIALDKKQNAKSLSEQKIQLNKELHEKLIIDAKVQLDKKQQAMINEQKTEKNKMQNSKSLLEQKIQLDKEQQSKSLLEQKVKLDKEMATKMKDQKLKLKLQEDKIIQQKAELDKQEAKMKEQKAKLDKEQK